MNQLLVEKAQICQGFLPADMKAGANAGDWVSMKDYGRLSIVFFKGPGTAGDDPVITVSQAPSVAGSGSKALPFTRVDKKQAATNLVGVGSFTTSTADAPAANDTFETTEGTWTNSALAEQAAIVVIEIKAEDLDDGFTCVQASVADVGTNAQLGALLYVMHEPRYQPVPLPSAIVD